MLTMWELPTFTTVTEAASVLIDLGRSIIKMQYQKSKRMSQKRHERNQVNDMMDEFIALVDDNAADAMVKANAEPSGTKAHTRFIAEHDQWLAVRNQAIEKRERLIRSKEQIRDLSKAF